MQTGQDTSCGNGGLIYEGCTETMDENVCKFALLGRLGGPCRSVGRRAAGARDAEQWIGADLRPSEKSDGQVRLYLTPSMRSYLDVAAADIVAVEIVPLRRSAACLSEPSLAAPSGSCNIPALLHQAGAEHHLDPDLLASVVHAESDGRVHAVSRVGARARCT